MHHDPLLCYRTKPIASNVLLYQCQLMTWSQWYSWTLLPQQKLMWTWNILNKNRCEHRSYHFHSPVNRTKGVLFVHIQRSKRALIRVFFFKSSIQVLQSPVHIYCKVQFIEEPPAGLPPSPPPTSAPLPCSRHRHHWASPRPGPCETFGS
jgi:hypothetical protein